MRKLSVFALMLLLVGQTIFGPLLTIQASATGISIFTFSEKQATVSGDSEVSLEYRWNLSEAIEEDASFTIPFPSVLEAVNASGTIQDSGIVYTVAGGQITATIKSGATATSGTFKVPAKLKSEVTGFTFAGKTMNVPVLVESEVSEESGPTDEEGGTERADKETEKVEDNVQATPESSTDLPRNVSNELGDESGHRNESDESTSGSEGDLDEDEKAIEGQPSDSKNLRNSNEFTSEVAQTAIDKIVARKGNLELKDIANYRPKIGEAITLDFYFTLPKDHNYGAGSTLTYELPDLLKDATGSGSLVNDKNEEYASFSVLDGKIIITFNDKIRFTGVGGSGGLEVKGDFSISAKYSATNAGTDLEQDLSLPGQDTIKLNFQPLNGKDVDKTVVAENENKNSQFVTWTVDVNTTMNDLGIGQEFKDTLNGTNHTYKESTLKIERYKVDVSGNRVDEKEDVTSSIAVDGFTSSSLGFTANLTGKYAYTITYETVPNDTDESSQTLTNNATFNGKTDTESTTIQYGAPLEKSVARNGKQSDWTIRVNENRKKMVAGVKVTDTWGDNADAHELVGDIIVKGLTLDEDYRINSSIKGFELELLKVVTEPFTIMYSTEPKDLITKGVDLQNSVVRSDRITDIKQAKTSWYQQNVLSKSHSNVNYQKKTVDWTIVLNSDGYEMTDVVLTDVFKDKNMEITGELIVDYGENKNVTHEIVDKGKTGFDINFTGTIATPITIKYTTVYDVRAVENLDTYTNIANLSWKTENKNYSVEVENAVDINVQQKAKGYKTGEYNYETKTFNWAVGINYNFDKITNPAFTDTLSESQKVLREKIAVYPLDLTSGGDGKADIDHPLELGTDYDLVLNEKGNEFTITFKGEYSEINKAYQIVYESVNRDDYYAPDELIKSVSNAAMLSGDGGSFGNWSKSIKVQHTDKLIGKSPQQVGTSARINWSLKLNWSQSTLDEVVIKDTVGNDVEGNPNQKVNEDSFEICEMNFKGTNSTPSAGTCHKPGTGLYTVSFEEPDSTFTITFNKPINKAYVVKYDAYFLGASAENLENEVKLTYKSKQEGAFESDEAKYNAKFNFSGNASAKKGQLVVTKVDDADASIKLAGAEFELWSAEKNGFLIERGVTEADGVYAFKTKVGQGDYYLIETKTPTGYVHDGAAYKELTLVTIKDETGADNNYVRELQVKNKKIRQSLEFIKTDKHDGTPLAGVSFELQKLEGNDYQVVEEHKDLVTGTDGKITIESLPAGSYQLIEKQTLPNYWLDKTPVKFEIDKDQTVVTKKKMENSKIGDLNFMKVAKEDNKKILPGAEFKLTNKSDEKISFKATSDDDGIVTFTGVKYGEYTLEETKAPEGYVASGATLNVIIDSETQSLAQPVENEKITQAVKLVKVDSTDSNKRLVGAEFELYTKDGEVVEELIDDKTVPIKRTTNDQGELFVNNLEPGDYYFLETKAPEHYLLDDDKEKRKTDVFSITKDQTVFTEVTASNHRGVGSLVITKVDADSKELLDGVKFELRNSDGVVVEGTTVLTVNGKMEYRNLPYDTYTLKETEPKAGYANHGKEYTFIISDAEKNNIVQEKTIENKKITHSVRLTKYDASKSYKLSGAIFELRKMDSSLPNGYQVIEDIDPEKLQTDSNGEIYLDELEVGMYQFVETKAPSGYYLDKTAVPFEITDQQTATVSVEKTNNRIYYPGPDPIEPEVPIDPPTDPETPTDPPTNPNPPTDPPTDTDEPGESEKPGLPSNPNEPGKPSNPGGSNNAEKPGLPGKPLKPDQPGQTGKPGAIGNSNNGGNSKLPQTGEAYPIGYFAVGIVLILLGGGMLLARRREGEN